METDLTRRMKEAVHQYKPAMSSNMRTIRFSDEVDVGTGFVDSIRFENYIRNIDDVYICRKLDQHINIDEPPICNSKSTCNGCIHKSSLLHDRQLGILTTCFELKITVSDFKSKNGHNFVGNKNYYVVPKELYPKIKDLVEEGIGVILYYGNGSLRIKKECEFRDITADQLNLYLFNALKKWNDRFAKIDSGSYQYDYKDKCTELTNIKKYIRKELGTAKYKEFKNKYDI